MTKSKEERAHEILLALIRSDTGPVFTAEGAVQKAFAIVEEFDRKVREGSRR